MLKHTSIWFQEILIKRLKNFNARHLARQNASKRPERDKKKACVIDEKNKNLFATRQQLTKCANRRAHSIDLKFMPALERFARILDCSRPLKRATFRCGREHDAACKRAQLSGSSSRLASYLYNRRALQRRDRRRQQRALFSASL